MRLPRIPGAAALTKARTGPLGVLAIQLGIVWAGKWLINHAPALAALQAGAEVHPAGALEGAYESGRQDGAGAASASAYDEGYAAGLHVGFTATPADPTDEAAPTTRSATDLDGEPAVDPLTTEGNLTA